ncbi:hypothetical protein L226DRAFT_369453 [Lentinus tigrinus ALCF2SS1-7]|uniref:Uncharacterized protein n=1 Tax=Lentinus tigrinus ALCF2SS1-6 TaxID=1328759 RepID=A0A5C2SAB4_9APHY|nr:hypothetical protein L227DRAFT_94197 [Lentinus tigrinus ALCF2SS1-6]RPD68071.1 hypothetical protein L226DRAFT_369453 [Lentinus tigrinus ALCF2SS1-7]
MSASVNLDWLALLLHGFYEENTGSHPPHSEVNDFDLDAHWDMERSTPSLDSLARLLIHQDRKQIVSIGLILPDITSTSQGPAEFLVAQNGGVSARVTEQLKSIIALLTEARALYVQDYDAGQRPILLSERTPLIAKLKELALSLHRHCWEKERRQVMKDSRCYRFHCLVEDVLGASADSRVDLSLEERTALQALQDAPPSHHAVLKEVRDVMYFIKALLSKGPEERHGFIPESRDAIAAETLMTPVRILAKITSATETLKPLWRLCDTYIEAIFARKQAERSKVPTASQPSTGTQGTGELPVIHKPFTIELWLWKICSIDRDYSEIVWMAVTRPSPFEHMEPQVSTLSVETRREECSICEAEVMSTLKLAGWNENRNGDLKKCTERFTTGFKAQLQSLCGHVESSDDSKYNCPMTLHCECVVLAELHRQRTKDRAVAPYVGVSKSSICAPCHLYFDCYGEVTGSAVRTLATHGTHDTHGQIWLWGTPTLFNKSDKPGQVDKKVKKLLVDKLKHRLFTEATSVCARQRASQSIIVSGVASVVRVREELHWNELLLQADEYWAAKVAKSAARVAMREEMAAATRVQAEAEADATAAESGGDCGV